jgi:hypothetical protein
MGYDARMKSRTAYIVVGLLLLVEWSAFAEFYRREVIPSYPRMYDQAAYLGETIDLYETWLEHGFATGLRQSLSGVWQHGVLVQHEAAFAYFFLGPTRLSAVTISFLHLAALQLLIVWLAVRAGRPLSGLAICGLLLSARTLMLEPGGLPDFRLDLAGNLLVCAVGLLVVASRGFRTRGWSVAVGIVGGVACLTRMIMAPYLALGYAAWLLIAAWFRHRPTVRPRLVNALIAATVTGVFVLPFAIAQFRALVGYYFVGTVTSDEKWLRAREFGIFTLSDHLTYYARSAVNDHAGYAFILAAACLLSLAGLRARALARRPVDRQAPDHSDSWWAAGFIVCVAAGAYAILTIIISKSPLVGNVFVGLAVPMLWLTIGGAQTETERRWENNRWVASALVLVMVGGVATFVHRCTRPSSVRLPAAEVANYMGVVDLIATSSTIAGGRTPTISFDELTEFFNVHVIRVMAWERHGIVLKPATGLGEVRIGLDAISRDEALAALARSDVALLSEDRGRGADSPLYPLNRSLQQWSSDLLTWASTNMVPLQEAAFFGRHITVFSKPIIACDSESGEWITSDGMRCTALGAALRRRPVLTFNGGAYPRYLDGSPTVQATIRAGNSATVAVSCDYLAGVERDGAQPYTVQCTLCPLSLPDDSVVAIRIMFDRHFVPRALGINSDERELVVQVSGTPKLESSTAIECPAQTDTSASSIRTTSAGRPTDPGR